MRYIDIAAAFANVPQRSRAFLKPSSGSSGGASARHYWRTLTPSEVSGTASASVWRPNLPRNAIANAPHQQPSPNDIRHRRHSHNQSTGPEPRRSSGQERNLNDEEYNPQRPTVPLAEHPAGPGGSTAA